MPTLDGNIRKRFTLIPLCPCQQIGLDRHTDRQTDRDKKIIEKERETEINR